MKKAKTKVKGQVATAQKVVIGIMMISAFMLGLNFAGLAMGMVKKPMRITKSRNFVPLPRVVPTPLMVEDIGDAKVSMAYWEGQIRPSAEFIIDDTNLGRLDIETNYYHQGSPVYTSSTSPLQVKLSHSASGLQTIPSRIIHISSLEGQEYNLCMPTTETAGPNDWPNDSFSYYYDVEGNPYYDALLGQRVLSKNCDEILANSLDIEEISSAVVNLVTMVETNHQIHAKFHTDFQDYTHDFGFLDMSINNFGGGNGMPNNITSPLAVSISGGSMNESTTVPARIINISDFEGQEYNICLPATELMGHSLLYPEPVIYFYVKNGTPYHDTLLTQRALAVDCNTVLDRALDIEDIGDANANLTVRDFPHYAPEIKFLVDFNTYWTYYGTLDLGGNYFNLGSGYGDIGKKAPLVIEVDHVDAQQEQKTVPARIVNISDIDGNSHTICVPKTVIPVRDLPPYERKLYFYDNNGTPYYDSLLMRRAIPQDCDDILARALDVQNISAAELDRDLDVEPGILNYSVDAVFEADFQHMEHIGVLNLTDNVYSDLNPISGDNIKSPLAMLLNAGPIEIFNLPYRNISITADGSRYYNLCVPPTLVPGWGEGNNSKAYFYDRNGKPYHDSLLLNRATCPPSKYIDIRPTEDFVPQ